eukprot:13950652-Alexandrium_andersonii.AAC.1
MSVRWAQDMVGGAGACIVFEVGARKRHATGLQRFWTKPWLAESHSQRPRIGSPRMKRCRARSELQSRKRASPVF